MRPIAFLLATLLTIPLAMGTATDAVQDDAGTGGDAGDDFDDATSLPVSGGSAAGSVEGLLVLTDDSEDWYTFMLTTPAPLEVTLETPQLACVPSLALSRATLLIVDPSGNVRTSGSVEGCDAPLTLSYSGDVAGTWRLAVVIEDPLGIQLQSISAAAEAPATVVEYVLTLDECQPWC